MVSLTALWLPIVLSAVIVFFVSAAVWMVMPHHKQDFKQAGDDEAAMDALRPHFSAPGMYYVPFAEGDEMRSEAYKERVRRGPVAIIKVRSAESTLNMGPAMGKSILLYLVISFFVAYLAAQTLGPGADYLRVFQVTGTAAFLAYGFIGYQESIWFALPGSVAFKHSLDGLAYSLLTAGMFGWLWPA